MKRARDRKSEAGFTLLETLIALVILSGALLAIYSVFSQGLNAQVRAKHAISLTEKAESVSAELAALYSASGSLDGEQVTAGHMQTVTVRVLSEQVAANGNQIIWFEVEVANEGQGAPARLIRSSVFYD
ncbi:MAG: prepilin-type N-terminal cleavage/methylation domain-containing protein [Pseudomonadota bacterium]